MDDYFEEERVLVQKYEALLYKNKSIYFDIEEFESIAHHYLLAGEYDKALNVAARAELCFPAAPEPGIIRARVLLDCMKADEAIDLLDRLENRSIDMPTINLLKGRAYLMEDKQDEAVREFEAAMLKEHETPAELSFSIADLLMEYGYLDAALLFLDRIFDMDTDSGFKADVYFQAATCRERSGNVREAERLYEKSLDEQPFNDYVWLSLGLLLEGEERSDEALKAYEFALTINNKLEPAVLGKANVLMQADRYAEAAELLKDFIHGMPDSTYALCCMGECAEQSGDYAGALDYYRRTLEYNPDMPEAYWGVGKVLKKQGDYENALRAVDRALSFDPDNADFLFLKGEIFFEIGSNNAALEVFRAASEICPEDTEIRVLISLILEETDIQAALSEMKKVYVLAPADRQIICRLAVLYYKIDDIDNCKYYLSRAPDYLYKFYESVPEACADDRLK